MNETDISSFYYCDTDSIKVKEIEVKKMNEIKEKIISDLKRYECDCRLSQDDDLICKRCNDNLFQSIYKIIERNFENDKGSTL